MTLKRSMVAALVTSYFLSTQLHADCTINPVPVGHIGTATCHDSTVIIDSPGIIGDINQSAIVIRDNPAIPNTDMTIWHNSGFANVWGDTSGKAGYDIQTANHLIYHSTTPFAFTTNDIGNHQSTGLKLQAGKNITAKIDSIVSNDNLIGIQALSDSGAIHLVLDQVIFKNYASGVYARTHDNDVTISINKDTSTITVDDNGIAIDVNVSGEGKNRTVKIDSSAKLINSAIGIQALANGNHIEITNRNAINAHQTGIFAKTAKGQIGIYNHANIAGVGSSAINAQTNGSEQLIVGSYAGNLSGKVGIQASNHSGKIMIDNRSLINSSSYGIAAKTNSGDIAVYNKNRVNSDSGTGIELNSSGAIHLENTSDVTGKGFAAINLINNGSKLTKLISTGAKLIGKLGIAVQGNSGAMHIQNRSAIEATQTGIQAGTNDGELAIQNFNSIHAEDYGIYTTAGIGKVSVYTDGAIESTLGHGIGALSESYDGQATFDIQGNITAKGTADSAALQIESYGSGSINIGLNAALHASKGIELNIRPSSHFEIMNTGKIDTLTDKAIIGTGEGSINITNDGTLFGNITVEASTNFINNGEWRLRHWTGSTDFAARDTKGIVTSTFGQDSILTNNGLIRFENVSAPFFNVEESYVPIGALSLSEGVEHGYLLNLSRFENLASGIIDLTTNNKAGDVLVISGSSNAGISGHGEFVTYGGAIKLDTVLNTGDVQSLSDMLVLDDVVYGTESTKIFINPMSTSTGGDTLNDGIKLIEVLGSSDSTAFELGAPVTHGLYEYRLTQGKNSDNWYLRNHSDDDDNGGGEENGGNTGGNNNGNNNGNSIKPPAEKEYFLNPNLSSLLGNQYAAMEMFYLSKSDRLNELSSKDSNIWLRTRYHQSDAKILNGKQSVEMSTSMVQLGTDLLKTDFFNAGLMAGIGESTVHGKSNQTQSKASGNVKGHQVGLYASWSTDEQLGPYLDVWAMYGWFNNRLNGASQTKEIRYDSRGIALSAEGGNTFILSQLESGSRLLMKPNAQFSYHRQKTDNFTDSHNTRYSNGISDGMKGRMGVKLAYQSPYPAINPYLEFNWFMNDISHGVELNEQRVYSEIGKTASEVKLGFQGKARKNMNVWGHIAGQSGSEKFRNTQVQVGMNYTF